MDVVARHNAVAVQVIPSGLTTQGRVTVLGAEVGFGLTMNSTFFKLELDAPVLSLGDGKVCGKQHSNAV